MKIGKHPYALIGVAAAFALTISACSSTPPSDKGSGEGTETPVNSFGISDDDYTLDALIAAAKEENGTLNVFDNTGKIVDVAEAFSKKYDLQVTGTKMKAHEQIETAIREAQANNVQSDVFLIIDVPSTVGELLPEEYVTSWFPPDLKDVVDARFQNPPEVIQEATIWTYNTEVYDQCPIENVWDLTDDEWQGRITMYDPLIEARYIYAWNQYALNLDDEMRAAYQDKFGTALATDEASAMHEWVKEIAQSSPQVFNSGSKMAEAIGAPGQKNPFIGEISTALYRSIAEDGLSLGACLDLNPNIGFADTKAAVIASGTKYPNTAKLFVHYIFTEEGIASQMADGKKSTNNTLSLPADEPSGVESFWDQVYVLDSKDALADYESLSDWQDFWMQHKK